MIELSGVTKIYDHQVVVDDVTLSIPAGGVTSIIGANGAGKSTMLSMIARLLPSDAGSITVAGMDVSTVASDRLARHLAILRQENHMTMRLTVQDLVAFGRYPYSKGRLTPEDTFEIERHIQYFDLGGLRNRFIDQLSGGQRQRAYVAMVMAQDTEFVLLDEPLNNLDMKHSVHMMRLLRRAADDLGKTIVIVIHDINFASTYSDSIIAMKRGKIVAAGNSCDIMTTECLANIYDMDIRIIEVDGRRIGVYF
ncbi:ATP-binding cassette domain-containing protein [Nocardia zapadnayensis]|uniref:iron ABC transporter ATP-binding protein n=1 Tax=Brevibacterium sp. R8603A2 TaxID=2929779 RepID=UPI001FF7E3EB|nr:MULTISPECIES: ATP-binding cassette domain-containing protein [Actinomycetes]MCK1803281.1 ATP-binding cassette domain-containing protein [Brevibacterium sp. R8603A2]MCX0276974.1 ATP-binding cassette domain-containing protein [Nocardia zapadnayensis]